MHSSFDKLLKKYVKGNGVKYSSWSKSRSDKETLNNYIESLSRAKPSSMSRSKSQAFYINLYNAVTIKLILDHYPVKSIKKIGGVFGSPWKMKLVKVEGKELTLNDIEHGIIRPRYSDARVHFALNCASVSCPPLMSEAYTGNNVEKLLTRATTSALKKGLWLKEKGNTLYVTKLFDWYRKDFENNNGSVAAFIVKYRPELEGRIEKKDIKFMSYNWNLKAPR